jgi:DNA replication and repair protein RecF
MILRSLSLTNFKNIESASLNFSDKLNCFLGNNGMGKSNVLDAIYYLSFCKSFTGVADALVVRRGEDFTIMQAQYLRRDADEDLLVSLGGGRRKSFKRGGKEYKKLSSHIGLFPAVLVAPVDSDLINGAGEERRRFIDMVIAQGDAQYLDHLIRYNHNLTQRNRLLRDGYTDTTLYLAIETAMQISADYICRARSEQIDRLAAIHRKYYAAIAGDYAEDTSLRYRSQMLEHDSNNALLDLFEQNRERDRILKYTSAGPHRDDIELSLQSMPVRRTASQGQQKTYTIALRLAQYEFLCETTGLKPMLLLDDIFDKLDARRVEAIIKVVANDTFGQIFITDTNRKHLDEILQHIPADHALWSVCNGVFTPLSHEEA